MELVRIYMTDIGPEYDRAKMKCPRCGAWGARWYQVENFVPDGETTLIEVVNCAKHGVNRPTQYVGLAKDVQK